MSSLFGDFNPSGRLSQTFYRKAYIDQVSFFDMNFRPGENNPGRGYRFYKGNDVVYPFGHGLSYTSFEYKCEVSKIIEYGLGDDLKVWVNVQVSNIGDVSGDETILLFMIPPSGSVAGQPIKQLRKFEKVFIEAKEQANVPFSLTIDDFSLANEDGKMETVRGTWSVQIGDVIVEIVV